EHAARIAEITWVMFIAAAVIFVVVVAMLILAIRGPLRLRRRLGQTRLIVHAAIIFPVFALSALLTYAFSTTSATSGAGGPPAAHIEVTGEMWWWRVRYLDAEGQILFETANDIRIPSGMPVDIVLRSENVIH